MMKRIIQHITDLIVLSIIEICLIGYVIIEGILSCRDETLCSIKHGKISFFMTVFLGVLIGWVSSKIYTKFKGR